MSIYQESKLIDRPVTFKARLLSDRFSRFSPLQADEAWIPLPVRLLPFGIRLKYPERTSPQLGLQARHSS